ncbi:MAG TPA: rhomboid family intramembrane serine protease, partial [Candidatus Polarisedimenticolaceae bacterium]
ALVPRAAWTCTECGAGLSRVRAPGLSRVISNLIPGATAATGAILLVNGLMFLVMLVAPPAVAGIEFQTGFGRLMGFDGATLLRYGSGVPVLTFEAGEWWRLITPLFLHAGILHFALNSMALASLGPLAEEEYGTERFGVMYLLSGLGGTLVAQYLGGVRTVGASGAICGLLGLLLVHGWRRGGAYGSAMQSVMARNAMLMVVMSLLPGIDWRSHLGGFLAGGLLGLVVPWGPYRTRAAATLWSMAALALLAISVFAFYSMAIHGTATLQQLLDLRGR